MTYTKPHFLPASIWDDVSANNTKHLRFSPRSKVAINPEKHTIKIYKNSSLVTTVSFGSKWQKQETAPGIPFLDIRDNQGLYQFSLGSGRMKVWDFYISFQRSHLGLEVSIENTSNEEYSYNLSLDVVGMERRIWELLPVDTSSDEKEKAKLFMMRIAEESENDWTTYFKPIKAKKPIYVARKTLCTLMKFLGREKHISRRDFAHIDNTAPDQVAELEKKISALVLMYGTETRDELYRVWTPGEITQMLHEVKIQSTSETFDPRVISRFPRTGWFRERVVDALNIRK